MDADEIGKKFSGYPGDVGKALEILVHVHFCLSLTTVSDIHAVDARRRLAT
jgi:hypothetical protein